MAQEIPKSKKYTDEVTTITPKDHGSWPGSHEKYADKSGAKSK
jgi:hypothetical protein